jgi:acetyl-CoA carboxylase carboxyltransferase component
MIQGAERGYIDDVIMPQATRPRIARPGDAAVVPQDP